METFVPYLRDRGISTEADGHVSDRPGLSLWLTDTGGGWVSAGVDEESQVLSWRGPTLSALIEEVMVGWYMAQVGGLDEVWFFTENGDTVMRITAESFIEDLQWVRAGNTGRRDEPPLE